MNAGACFYCMIIQHNPHSLLRQPRPACGMLCRLALGGIEELSWLQAEVRVLRATGQAATPQQEQEWQQRESSPSFSMLLLLEQFTATAVIMVML